MVLIGRNDKINFSSIFDKKKMIYEFERFAISYGLTLIIKRVNWLSAGPLNLRALCGCTVRTTLRPPLRNYISDLAWSLLGVEPAELSDISVDREVFWVLQGFQPPRLFPRKRGYENEKMN